jgi:hypothetical protein
MPRHALGLHNSPKYLRGRSRCWRENLRHPLTDAGAPPELIARERPKHGGTEIKKGRPNLPSSHFRKPVIIGEVFLVQSCSFDPADESNPAALRLCPEFHMENAQKRPKNAQSIALFHNTNAAVESRIFLATEAKFGPKHIP